MTLLLYLRHPCRDEESKKDESEQRPSRPWQHVKNRSLCGLYAAR